MTRTLRKLINAALVGLVSLAAAGPGGAQDAKVFKTEQLDQMLAPIALYPDSLLSQVLMASTYPADVAEAVSWSKANARTTGDAAVKAVESKPWDPSVQSLVAFPQALAMMGEKPDWVQTVGDAFLAQPDEVMDSVQRLRAAAQKQGNLKTTEQQKVVVEQAPQTQQTIIKIEPSNPQVVYVPAYNPTVQRIVSTPGKRDGLYWASLPGERASPLGPAYGEARPGDAYHGYHFRILKAQGPNAPGGAYDYRVRGRMIAGFGLVAWPAKYGDTGVMTFILSHAGQLYQKDLGPGTDALARAMTRFDPDDSTWEKVTP